MKINYNIFTLFLINSLLFFVNIGCSQKQPESGFPRIYVKAEDKAEIKKKIQTNDWAAEAFQSLKEELSVYIDRHQVEPDWIISRMAMYWKDGEHYTQCYLKDQNWDYGEGNAPFPTVRMPGMRTWNKYYNVALADRIPYNETGDMWGIDRTNPDAPAVLVPYKESGHMIRANNNEILSLAEKAAFVYWITGEKKYASFAGDIFYHWLIGTWYMNPILDPEQSTGGPGGWEPGGICGYYDYEQIHDDLATHTAVIYDFMFEYLSANPHPHIQVIGKELKEIAGTVFKRFIDLGMIRGAKSGNWNVNGWNMIIRPILVLDNNEAYEDGKGREYYLHYLTKESTPYHDAIPDILKSYDSVTGLWPESPGYAFGIIGMLLDFAVMLQNNDIDIIKDNEVMQKAAMAVFPWMDKQANLINFGDSRGGTVNFKMFEQLLTYYTRTRQKEKASIVANALQIGINTGKYDRKQTNWMGISTFTNDIPATSENVEFRMSYSPHHRLITMKNDKEEPNLMTVLYGGVNCCHLTPNGLALQLYGFGWALAPDASGYESYWSKDMIYHQSAVGSNTILPGYTHGDITIEAMEPVVPESQFTNITPLGNIVNFADVTAAEKRRLVAMVNTSSSTGYYIDIFRSNQSDNDYLFHLVGNTLDIINTNQEPLLLNPVQTITKKYHPGYDYFTNIQTISYTNDFIARWTTTGVIPSISVQMWMPGANNREIYTMNAPYTYLGKALTPGNVSTAPGTTPTLLVRQSNNNAWDEPFIALFEPYQTPAASILSVEKWQTIGSNVGVTITSEGGIVDYILSTTDPQIMISGNGVDMQGNFALIREIAGEITCLYLGKGTALSKNGYKLTTESDSYVTIYKDQDNWYYSSETSVTLLIEGKTKHLPAAYAQKIE